MFAVPGWSVASDSLKTQRQVLKENGKIAAESGDSEVPAKLSKKRKRNKRNCSSIAITEENFGDLWRKHIEGSDVPRGQDSKGAVVRTKRSKRDQRKETGIATNLKNETLHQSLPRDDEKIAQRGKLVGGESRPRKGVQLSNGECSSTTETTSGRRGILDTGSARLPDMQQPAGSTSVSAKATTTLVLTPLQRTMKEKLVSSRFRYLNQTLYTEPSTSSSTLFQANPTLFTEYHLGFQQQVAAWPENPVDGFVKMIKERGAVGRQGTKLKSQKAQFRKNLKHNPSLEASTGEHETDCSLHGGIEPLPRDSRSGLCTIADLGCGTAQIAQSLASNVELKTKGPILAKSLNARIHSFDLADPSPLITVADIRSLPLPDSSVDVAIFCLALMGTNWIEFVEEAWRILRWKGECWVSEVGSRFGAPKAKRVDHSSGRKVKTGAGGKMSKKLEGLEGEDITGGEIRAEEERKALSPLAQASTDVSAFVDVLQTRGFVLVSEPELANKMFVRMRFKKALTPTRGKHVPVQNDAGGQTWGSTRRFVDRNVDDDGRMNVAEEGQVLKPCVYKSR